MEHGPVYWDAQLKMHVADVAGTPCPVRDLGAVLDGTRTELITKLIAHFMAEVAQPQFSGQHGRRAGYMQGCRGLLCRRAHRLAVRSQQAKSANARYEVLDELITEAESRILPNEIIGHVHFADKVASL
jgi:hypothetical protein